MAIVSAVGDTQRCTSPSNTNHPEGTWKVATASTAMTNIGRKACKTAHFQAAEPRAVFGTAVDNDPLAVDHLQQYQPQESPANRRINDGAGDAGGILRCFSVKANAFSFSAVLHRRLEVLKASLNVAVDEELALDGPEDLNRQTIWGLSVSSGRMRRSTGPYGRFCKWRSENTPSAH